MRPINQEQVVQTAQILLAVLSDEAGVTPNKYLEGVVSGKSLLSGIVKGNLVVCVPGQPEEDAGDAGDGGDGDAAPVDKS